MSIWQGSNMIAGSGGGGIANYDGKSITENSMEEIQTVGVINSRDSSTAVKTWTGTKAQYDAIVTKDPNTLYNITDDVEEIAITRALGQMVESTIPLVDAGLHLLDGAVIAYGSYKAFVDYMAGLVTDYPDLFTTEADWQTSVTNYGVCGKFVYDSVGKTVRLPKITGFTEGTIDPTVLGDLVEAGLPNITGEMQSNPNISSSYSNDATGNTGAFYKKDVSTTYGSGYVSEGQGKANYVFDASLSNSIYGNSTTVQPQSIKVLYYICIATSTKTDIEVDIDEIATDLNGKADIDLSNVLSNIDYVVESKFPTADDPTWYRVYKSGWVEQGGYFSETSNGVWTVTLLKPYTTSNYYISGIADNYAGVAGSYVMIDQNTQTTTGFTIRVNYTGTNPSMKTLRWEAKGMGAN